MSHPLPARRRLVLLVAVLAALALAAGFAWRSTPVPVQNSAYAFACPRSVSVQTQGDRSTFWVKGTQVGGIDCYPALPWETLNRPPPHRHPGRLGPSLLRLPAGVQRPGPAGDLAGGRGPDPHPLLLPRRGVL